MATVSQWAAGARPRTLPAAIAAVAVGAGLAAHAGDFDVVLSVLALVVAVALQVGVNYANDYSDGIRGTDENRIGPVRLVGQGLASPVAVKRAALLSMAVAAIAGAALILMSGHWWLFAVGLACIAAAWLYTGGPRPYGYAGLGEVFVFVFFGLVPVVGTSYVQTDSVTALDLTASVGVGLLATAILVTNNLRDIPSDTAAGKRTLAVRLGDDRTRILFAALVLGALAIIVPIAALSNPWVLVALMTVVLALAPLRIVLSAASGPALIPALKATGILLLAYGIVLGVALAAT